MIIGNTPTSAVVCVTEGFISSADQRTQKAVFASLLSRFHEGGVSWTTLLALLMWRLNFAVESLWTWIRTMTADGERPQAVPPTWMSTSLLALVAVASMSMSTLIWMAWSPQPPPLAYTILGYGFVLFGAMVCGLFSLSVLRALLNLSYRRLRDTMLLSADAEALLLLKEPDPLVQALATVLSADNQFPHNSDISYLAFATSGAASEVRTRLEQMERLLGREPVADMLEGRLA